MKNKEPALKEKLAKLFRSIFELARTNPTKAYEELKKRRIAFSDFDVLIELLMSDNPHAIGLAFTSAAKIPTEELKFRMLMKWLRSDNPLIRSLAAMLIARIPTEGLREELDVLMEEAEKSNDPHIRFFAAISIEEIYIDSAGVNKFQFKE